MKRYILLLLFGVAAIFYMQGTMVIYRAFNSIKWPAANGVIISSAVTYHAGSARKGAYYSPDVSYRYTVGTTSYVNDTICFASVATRNNSDMSKIAGRYPSGRDVKVYFNPAAPQESVLEPGITFNSFTKVLGASFFLLVGLVVLLFTKGKTSNKIAIK